MDVSTISTGIPILDRIIGIVGAIAMLASLLAHFIPEDTKAGKLVSWVALNFGKALRRPEPPPSNLVELKPVKKDGGFARIGVLAGIAIGTLIIGLALKSLAVLGGAIFFSLLVIACARYRGPYILLLALLMPGCAYVKATGEAIRTCAGQVVSDADWNDVKPFAGAALQLDRVQAFVSLYRLAEQYGPHFIDCLVAELRKEFAQVAAARKAQALAAGPLGIAVDNANAWLARAR